MRDCDQDLQSRGISIAVAVRSFDRSFDPLECGAVGALCTIDIALFQSAAFGKLLVDGCEGNAISLN